jgi:hypothetical protein
LKLKRLSKDGTLLSISVDMELAQALGAGDSFLATNEPEYSKIYAKTSEEVIVYFVRCCYTHAKRFVHMLIKAIYSPFPCIRGIHDLRTHVTDEEYNRLINFLYLKTPEDVEEFSEWITSLHNPKVQGLLLVMTCDSLHVN